MPTGNYSHYWDGECNSNTIACVAPISLYAQPIVKRGLVIVDNATGESKTISALAEYFDGYN